MRSFHIERAARTILAGGVVAYPTEAVFGLGCLPLERRAVERLLAIKGRSRHKGFIVIAATIAQLDPLVELPDGPRGDEIRATWPGPVTWVLPGRPGLPSWLTGGRATLAVRVTEHALASRLCERAGYAIVSTSANRSARPPIKRLLRLRREFGTEVDYILAGPTGGAARPTAIRDGLTGRELRAA